MSEANEGPAEPMRPKRFRCEDGLWSSAMVKAKSEGTTISALLRGFLITYTRGAG